MKMNRRQFLQTSAGIGASLLLGNSLPVHGAIPSCGNVPPGKDSNFHLNSVRIIDAHAHPSMFHFGIGNYTPYVNESSTVDQLCGFGVETSVFAAIGDMQAAYNGMASFNSDFFATKYQLSNISSFSGDVKIIKKASDIPNYNASGVKPGALMAIEGGQALMGDVNNVNHFHQYDNVRMITLMHYTPSDHPHSLGDIMTAPPFHGGLSPLGEQVLLRMIDLNMVIDVAHASADTLFEVCLIAQKEGVPVIDSHTSLLRSSYTLPLQYARMRSLGEMQAVASTGGVVCTWPLQCVLFCNYERVTIEDWAAEIEELIHQLGSKHVGLGTDGGGNLPARVDGYLDITNLNFLADELYNLGLSSSDIQDFMGGNVARVLNQVLV